MTLGDIGDWLDFMPDTVLVYPYSSVGAGGQPSYSATAYSISARIEIGNRIVRDGNGKEVVARGLVILGTVKQGSALGTPGAIYTPNVLDKVVLPSDFTPTTPPLINSRPVRDEGGLHHVELDIG